MLTRSSAESCDVTSCMCGITALCLQAVCLPLSFPLSVLTLTTTKRWLWLSQMNIAVWELSLRSADAELWETLLELQQFHVFTVCFFVCWAVLWLCFSACSLCSVVLFCCWAVFLALPVTVKSVRQWKQLFHHHLIWINKAELLSLSPPVGVCLLLLLWLCEADSVVVQCVGVLHRLVVLLTTLSNALVTSCWCPVWLLWQDSKWVEEKQYLLRTNQELHEKVDDDNLCASHTFLE